MWDQLGAGFSTAARAMEIWKDKIYKYGEQQENEHIIQQYDDGDDG